MDCTEYKNKTIFYHWMGKFCHAMYICVGCVIIVVYRPGVISVTAWPFHLPVHLQLYVSHLHISTHSSINKPIGLSVPSAPLWKKSTTFNNNKHGKSSPCIIMYLVADLLLSLRHRSSEKQMRSTQRTRLQNEGKARYQSSKNKVWSLLCLLAG